MSAPKKNYYDWLGVSFYAAETDIRRGCESALRAIDLQIEASASNTGTVAPADGATTDPRQIALAEQRKKIMQAYMVLKDDARRKRYNASLAEEATKQRGREVDAKEIAALIAATASQHAPKTVAQRAPDQREQHTAPYENQWSRPSATAAHTQAAARTLTALATPATANPEQIDLLASMQARRASGELVNTMGGVRDDEREYAHLGVRFTAMMIDTGFVMLLGFAFVLVDHVLTMC